MQRKKPLLRPRTPSANRAPGAKRPIAQPKRLPPIELTISEQDSPQLFARLNRTTPRTRATLVRFFAEQGARSDSRRTMEAFVQPSDTTGTAPLNEGLTGQGHTPDVGYVNRANLSEASQALAGVEGLF